MAAPTDGSHETFRAYERPAGPTNRSFGLTLTVVLAVVCGLSLWRAGGVSIWLLGVTAGFLLVTVTVPALLTPLNRIWTAFGRLLHVIVSPAILAILFYGMITPMGLLARLFGHDPLRRRIEHRAASYWIERPVSQSRKSSMKKQF